MGRQIQLNMLPQDAESLLKHVMCQHDVLVVKRDEGSPIVKSLVSAPRSGNETLILWNRELLPRLSRRLSSAAHNTYRVDEQGLTVLEFSLSILGRWQNIPALTQGRIYGVFENKPKEFSRWFDQITRYIRKFFVRNPASLPGYVGPAAYQWFLDGGLLLPTFLPPDTPAWRKFFDDEASLRSHLNAAAGRTSSGA